MIFRDATGAVLEKGSRVTMPLALAQSAQGVVQDTFSGLGLDGTMARQPVVILQIAIVLPADGNGIVAGVCRLPDPPVSTKPVLVEE
jgi:hypothetical protein